MYVVVWEFRVERGQEAEFERAYGPDGDWVQLFRRGAGFLGSDLLRDDGAPGRYLTLDRWSSRADYDAFRTASAREYQALDARCEALTTREAHVGSFAAVGGD